MFIINVKPLMAKETIQTNLSSVREMSDIPYTFLMFLQHLSYKSIQTFNEIYFFCK